MLKDVFKHTFCRQITIPPTEKLIGNPVQYGISQMHTTTFNNIWMMIHTITDTNRTNRTKLLGLSASLLAGGVAKFL